MAESSPVEIAIAVVEFDGQFLIGERPEGGPMAGYWEFPGGKIEPDETPQAAAARECLEETGIEVSIGDAYPEVVHQYDHDKLRLHFFRAFPTEVTLPTNDRFLWVPREQLAEYQFPEANAGLLEVLIERSERPTRDLKFWLGPAQAITVLIFAGLLMNSEGRPGAVDKLVIAAVGLILLLMPLANHAVSRGERYNLRQGYFDLTAIAVTAIFARFASWATLLIWIPLILLRRLQ